MSVQPWEPRVSRLEGAFEQIGDRLNGIERRLDRVEGTIESRFGWMMGTLIATWITTMLTVLFHH